MVKSVKRAFMILELFKQERNPLEAIEVSRELDLPLTSTHALLNTLNALEYLDYDKSKRAFFPSRNLPILFAWMQDSVEGEGQLMDFLEQLNKETEETISVSRLSDIHAKIVYGHESVHPVGVRISKELRMPIGETITGLCLVASLNEDEFQKFSAKLKLKAPDQMKILRKAETKATIETIRSEGIIVAYDMAIGGIGAVCMPIVSEVSRQRLTVGIVGPTERIKESADQHVKTLKKLSKFYGIEPKFPTTVASGK